MKAPMTLFEFKAEIVKLDQVYGAKYFPEARTDLLWKTFQRLPIHVFKDIVNRVIAECMSPPSVERIVEIAKGIQQEIAKDEQERSGPFDRDWPFCECCSNQGFIHGLHKKLKSYYLFGCPGCKRAEHLNPEGRQLVVWEPKWDSQYILERPIMKRGSVRRTPWPANIEGLMLQIEDGRHRTKERGFKASLAFCRLTEDQAWKLYEFYVERKFDDLRALEIIRNRSASQNIAKITIGLEEKLLLNAPQIADHNFPDTMEAVASNDTAAKAPPLNDVVENALTPHPPLPDRANDEQDWIG